MQKLNQLKREIDAEVRLGVKPTKEKQEKIREYVDLCFETYSEQKMSLLELEFLEKALDIIPMRYSDVIKFARKSAELELYGKAVVKLRKRKEKKIEDISEEREEKLKKIEGNLLKAYQVRRAMLMMKNENKNIKMISSMTGLSDEEINILKIKLFKKPVKLRSVFTREKIVQMLYEDEDPYKIQEKYDITDFEMEDIRDQVRCKRLRPIIKYTDIEMQIKQDSQIRIEMLCIKLGKKPEEVAKMFKLQEGDIQKHINSAIQFGLIKPSQLNGIDPLSYQKIPLEELEI